MKINFDNKLIKYTGRTDVDENGSHWYFPSTSAEVHFKGTKISVEFESTACWGVITLGYIIDGRMGKLAVIPEFDRKTVTLQCAESLEPDKLHSFTFFKTMAANHSVIIKSFETDGEFVEFEREYSLNIEYYGDSVSAGECTEADYFAGHSDPCNHGAIYDNSYFSYTWQCARLLNARFHNISQGGISVLNGMGYFHAPDLIGMESVYDKVCYFPEGGALTQWDFSRYTPDVTVFVLGQNDHHIGKDDSIYDIHDPVLRRKWKDAYIKLISDVDEKYGGKPEIILMTTVLMHDPDWDNAIDEVAEELRQSGKKAHHFMLSRCGKATPGHPRRVEHSEMAGELANYISSLGLIKRST